MEQKKNGTKWHQISLIQYALVFGTFCLSLFFAHRPPTYLNPSLLAIISDRLPAMGMLHTTVLGWCLGDYANRELWTLSSKTTQAAGKLP
jgi:hypothetical protein